MLTQELQSQLDALAAATRRWARFVMPVMAEVDCDDDTVTRVVVLPEEIRDDLL